MLLDKDGAFQCASYLALRFVVVIVMVGVMLLLLHANEHFSEEIALQFLPVFAVFAHMDFTMEAQFSESINASVRQKKKISMQSEHTVEIRDRANYPHASSIPPLPLPNSPAVHTAWNATTSTSPSET